VPDLRLAIQRRLERGQPVPLGGVLASGWARLARVERPLSSDAPVLCVGGSTLGGSGKTPLAVACARFLSERGARVALVAHGYRASPPREPRRVSKADDVARVGDEALECARALEDVATVWIARRRQDALDAAAASADVVVLDGPLQLAPRRATLSLLAVDEADPWGSGACPPLGDLRAPKDALLAATDQVVPVRASSRGARLGGSGARSGTWMGWGALAKRRVGLATGVARPRRVVDFLRRHGVTPHCVVTVADHAPLRIPRWQNVDLWLTTEKDAAKIRPTDEPAGRAPRAEVAVLDYYLNLPVSVRNMLAARFPFRF
jgi:tetraacyldisaccharide 4'-kinase